MRASVPVRLQLSALARRPTEPHSHSVSPSPSSPAADSTKPSHLTTGEFGDWAFLRGSNIFRSLQDSPQPTQAPSRPTLPAWARDAPRSWSSQNSKLVPVGIFWDMENLTVKHSKVPEAIKNIREVASEYGAVRVFKSYKQQPASRFHTHVQSLSLSMQELVINAGVDFCACPSTGRKGVVDNIMMQDMFTFALDHRAPATVVLLSGDGDFTRLLSTLRQRHYRTVVIYPAAHDSGLLFHASHSHLWANIAGSAGELDSEAENDEPPHSKVARTAKNRDVVDQATSTQQEARVSKKKKARERMSSLPPEAFVSLIHVLNTFVSDVNTGAWITRDKLKDLLESYDPNTERYLRKWFLKPYFQRAEQLGIIIFDRRWTMTVPEFGITLHPKYITGVVPEDVRKAAQRLNQENHGDIPQSPSYHSSFSNGLQSKWSAMMRPHKRGNDSLSAVMQLLHNLETESKSDNEDPVTEGRSSIVDKQP